MDSLQVLETAEANYSQCSIGKELGMHSRLLTSFKMKEDKAVVDAYPHDGDMVNKPSSILFQFGKEIAISEKS